MSGSKQFSNPTNAISRRSFLKASALTVGGTLLAACAAPAGSAGRRERRRSGGQHGDDRVAPLGLGRCAGRGRL